MVAMIINDNRMLFFYSERYVLHYVITSDIEFFIGLPKIEQMRVSRIKNTSTEEMLKEITREPQILMQNIDGLRPPNESNFFRMLDQVSVLGYVSWFIWIIFHIKK